MAPKKATKNPNHFCEGIDGGRDRTPKDALERAARDNFNDDEARKDLCCLFHPARRFFCTLDPRHLGDHVASNDTDIVARWGRDPVLDKTGDRWGVPTKKKKAG
jgi:hypothetical protein